MKSKLETVVALITGSAIGMLIVAFLAAIYLGIGFLLMMGGLYAYKLVMGG